jgi:hypothetical protein
MTREEKIERYIASVIDQMDYTAMYMYVWESISEAIENDSDEQIDEMYNYHFEDNDEERTD